MIKKFWSYQLILSGSFRAWKTNDDSSHPNLKATIILCFVLIVTSIGDNGMYVIFMALVYPLFILYYIINSPQKLYDVPPVSKLYHSINIYLFPVLVSIGILIPVQGIILIFNIIKHFVPKLDFIKIDLLVTFGNIKFVVVIALLFIIIACIFIPSFFVKHLAIRRTYIAFEIVFVKIALSLFSKRFVYNDGSSFLGKINLTTNYSEMLMILIACCIVMAPSSIMLSYRIYRGKERNLCLKKL
ncbi:MAG: hypothetical protein ACERKV_09225 [Clostridiaceae bacterium]